MNERIAKLRRQTLDAVPRISSERARLLTEYYSHYNDQSLPVPLQRANAFDYIMGRKSLPVNEGELILGERGESPKATPTYPEIAIHSLEDLVMIDGREKVPFRVDDKVMRTYQQEIIPFWHGRSLREELFSSMNDEWLDAYQAGVFTEFLEQRSPGHTVLGGDLFRKGLGDVCDEIHTRLEECLDEHEVVALTSMDIAARAVINYARRYAAEADRLASVESLQERKEELLELSRMALKVPERAPDTFHEALQHYWFLHQGVINELNPWDSFNPGRLDQHLYPFYKKGLEDGSLSMERAKDILSSFWVKFNNHPSPPKTGVTAKESNTYTDFSLINTGGVKEDGADAVNDLSYLILEVIEEMRLLQPSSMVQISSKTPDEFLQRALRIVKTGYGQPSIFNTDMIIKELVAQGKTLEDARMGGASGCVEAGAFGKESYILTGYFNLPKILELALNDGYDPRTKKQLGPRTGMPGDLSSFDDVMKAFGEQLKYFAEVKLRGNDIIERLWAERLPAPFLSTLIEGCVQSGKDYNAGGAKYHTRYVQGVGLGSVTDSLAAIKHEVFAEKKTSLAELVEAMHHDFQGHEMLRHQLLYDAPKYGNDDDQADSLATAVFELFHGAIDGRPSVHGGTYRINLLPTTSHVYFGSVTGALPDGRKAYTPLSEGISPVQGADMNGPTAVLKSAAKLDHSRTGGTLLNQKFTPDIMRSDDDLRNVGALVRAYFELGGHHVQFNVVDAKTLLRAKKEPHEYKDLIVRVAGYSDYFIDLTEELQDEIIRRTEHQV